ncbi:MAG: patatin-like phospholipase family protein [Anaerovoracaceae bacterium]
MKDSKNSLVLSGGGSRGGYEIGVWKALRELNFPIHIVTGASVGAINGGMIVQNTFDESVALWQELETHMVFDIDVDEDRTKEQSAKKRLNGFDFEVGGMSPVEALAYAREIVTKGGAGSSGLKDLLDKYIDEKLIRESPIEFGIVTVEFPSMKPHYLFKEDIPHGKMKDYILASASCFPAVQPTTIQGKKYIDGGYADVMPIEMAMNKGADNIVGVNLDAAGFVRKNTIKEAQEHASKLIIIESHWNLGNFLIFDKNNTHRIIQLGYLNTMKAFHRYDGDAFTFEKGAFPEKTLRKAEAAAKIFGVDPLKVYSVETLNQALIPKIRKTLSAQGLTVRIAKDLALHSGGSIFLNKHFLRLFRTEVLAAAYILHARLI